MRLPVKFNQVILDARNIINNHDQPFFVYYQSKLEENLASFVNYFDGLFAKSLEYSFSVKTQPNFKFINFFKEKNLNFDVSSFEELDYVLKLGVHPSKVSLGGIGVEAKAIEKAIKDNIEAIHCDSLESLTLALSQSQRIKTKITVRLNYKNEPSKIGFYVDEVQALNNIKLDGLHVYLGRESFDLVELKKMLKIVEKLFENKNIFSNKPVLFLGPGMPILEFSKYLDSTDRLSFPYQVKVESGRALCASAGYYSAQVLSVKPAYQQKRIVTIDGGLQHLGSPWVSFKQGPLLMEPLYFNAKGEQIVESGTEGLVYGSLCLWHDCLHPRITFPKNLKRDDWILVPFMGAYGLTAGVPLFIGEKLPKEFYNENGKLFDVTHSQFHTYLEGF
jgi:diaminopimelate decarboxylase